MACCLDFRRFDPAKQNRRLRHIAFSQLTENLLAIYQHGQITTLPGPDFWFDSKLFLRCLLQAHGCTAQVLSKETTDDFDVHRCMPAPVRFVVRLNNYSGLVSVFALPRSMWPV